MNLAKIIVLGLCAAAPFAAHAADDDWFKGKLFPPELVLKSASSLNLTDPQRKTIRSEIVKVQTAVAGVDVEVLEEGLAIQEAIDKLPIDRAVVLAHADKVFAAEARKKRAWLEMLVSIKNVLTSAQAEVLRKLVGGVAQP